RPFGVHQRRYRIGKRAGRIAPGRKPARFDEDRPARSEPAQRVVEPRRDTDQLGGRSAFEVGAAELRGALKAAVLVEDAALFDERRPWQEVGEVLRLVTVFGEIEHDYLKNRDTSDSGRAGAQPRRRTGPALRPRQRPCGRSPRTRARRSTAAVRDRERLTR